MPDMKAAGDYCMGFVSQSDKWRSQFVEKWREVDANFILDAGMETDGGVVSPYYRNRIYTSPRRRILLKDPETHKLVMTYAAKLTRTIFGDPRHEYIRGEPVGYEDAPQKAPTVTKLLRYNFGLPGHFRSFLEGIIDMVLFGTSILEVYWKYEEREMPVRSVASDYGVETSTMTRLRVPTFDDVCIRPIDIMRFYPDPARYRIQDMSGAAKGFDMNAAEAMQMVAHGIYNKEGVARAIGGIGKNLGGERPSESFRQGLDQPSNKASFDQFKEMSAYEYWGDVPTELGIKDDDTGEVVERGVITVLNGETVRVQAWPIADPHLPWHTLIINPVQGRFYGISPAETVRFDQSFADALKILLAEAIIRQVHPPIAIDSDSEVDPNVVKAWKADAIIMARGGPNAVGTLRYDANVQNGFGMLQGLKMSIQESSGALGGIQGEPGPDREAASVGVQRIQMALDRPELAGMVLENECLPSIAASVLRLDQQYLSGTEDLKKRIGELPEPIWIGDIMGDFDIKFMGSRMVASRQQKLQAVDRIIAYSQAVPGFQVLFPNRDFAEWILGDLLELPELAAKIGNPQDVMQNMLAMQAFGQGGGNNGVPQSSEPAGMMPGQAGGAAMLSSGGG